MKNSFLTKLLIVVLLALTGCTAIQTKEPAPIFKKVIIAPDDVMIASCHVTKPPVVKDYLAETLSGREALLTDTIQLLYTDLSVCNKKLKALRDWKIQQLKIMR